MDTGTINGLMAISMRETSRKDRDQALESSPLPKATSMKESSSTIKSMAKAMNTTHQVSPSKASSKKEASSEESSLESMATEST